MKNECLLFLNLFVQINVCKHQLQQLQLGDAGVNGHLAVFLAMVQEKDIVKECVFLALTILEVRTLHALEMIKKMKTAMILLAMLYIAHLDISTALGMHLCINHFKELTVRAWVDLTLLAPQKMITSQKF